MYNFEEFIRSFMKRVITFFLFLFTAVNIFSIDYVPSKPSFSFQQDFLYNFIPSAKNKGLAASLTVTADAKPANISIGVNTVNSITDITTQLLYLPEISNNLHAGLGFIYHLDFLPAVFSENDFIPGIYVKWDPSDIFGMDIRLSYMWKSSLVNTSTQDIIVPDKSFCFEIKWNWHIPHNWTCYGIFASSNYFEYPLLLTAFFSTGFENLINKKILIGFRMETELTSYITAPSNFTNLKSNLYVKYTL